MSGLNRSEARECELLQQLRDHQDAISSLIEALLNFKTPTGRAVLSAVADRTLLAMEESLGRDPNILSCGDLKAGSNLIATSGHSDTVFHLRRCKSTLQDPIFTPLFEARVPASRQMQASIFSRRNLPVVITIREVTFLRF